MSKSKNIQPGHYRTYRESGKTITINGGPKYYHVEKGDWRGPLVLLGMMLILGLIASVLFWWICS